MGCSWHSEQRCVRRGAALGAVLILAGTPLSLAGCHRGSSTTAAPAPASVPVRPREVLAEVIVPEPRQTWPQLLGLSGPLARSLPQAPELAVAAFLGVPALSANSFDLRSPLVLVWLAGDTPGLVIGVHLESGPELIAKLTTGAAPTHRVERVGALSLFFSLADAGRFAFALSGDTLLIGPREPLTRAGEYVARALAPKAPTHGPISLFAPGEALRAFGGGMLRAAWAARRAELSAALTREQVQRGRPADFADPAALLGWLDGRAQQAIAASESLREARAELRPADGRVELELELRPEPTGAAQELSRGLRDDDIQALRSLPAQTALGLFWRRETSAADAPLARALFGARFSPKDQQILDSALQDVDAGRGDLQALGLLGDLGVVWRGNVNDAQRLRTGIGALLPLITHKPWADALAATFGRASLAQKPPQTLADGTLQRTTLRFAKASASAPPSNYEFDTLISDQRFVMSLAREGSPSFDSALAAEAPSAGLAADPAVGPLLAAIQKASFAAAADLSRFGLSAPDGRAALTADLSVRDGALHLTLRLQDGALRALVTRGLLQ